jgi:hypothetical protein
LSEVDYLSLSLDDQYIVQIHTNMLSWIRAGKRNATYDWENNKKKSLKAAIEFFRVLMRFSVQSRAEML